VKSLLVYKDAFRRPPFPEPLQAELNETPGKSPATVGLIRANEPELTYATLDRGGWLNLTPQGLPPCKKRQASLGALTSGRFANPRMRRSAHRAVSRSVSGFDGYGIIAN